MRSAPLLRAVTLAGVLTMLVAGPAEAQLGGLKKKMKKAATEAAASAVGVETGTPQEAGPPAATPANPQSPQATPPRPFAEEFAALLKVLPQDPDMESYIEKYYAAAATYNGCTQAASEELSAIPREQRKPWKEFEKEKCGEGPDMEAYRLEEEQLRQKWPAPLGAQGFTEESYDRFVAMVDEHFTAYLELRAEQATGELPGLDPEVVTLFDAHRQELEKYLN